MKRFSFLVAVVLASLVAMVPAAHAVENDLGIPPGYSVFSRRELAAGLSHITLISTTPGQRVHLALLRSGAPFELRAVLSNEAIAGEPLIERTSSMCIRVRCVVAVNGDFWAHAGYPIGGLVVGGELVRSPNPRHHQLTVAPDGSLDAGPLAWKGTLVSTDLKQLGIDGVNVERRSDRLVLYTPAFGPSTEQNPFGVEMTLEIVQPSGPLSLGQTALVRFAGLRSNAGNTPIPAGGAVLSGHGRRAGELLDLWSRVHSKAASGQALLRLESTPAVTGSIGGTPILVRDGKRWFADDPRELYVKRHPRTIVGWNARGDVLLVTIDGRQPGTSEGMTMAEAAQLMIDLGATDALNLDGGGSTAFVTRGIVANVPSDRTVRRGGVLQIVREARRGERVLGFVERPVATALAIVPRGGPGAGLDDPLAGGPIELPTTVPLPASPRYDPASNLTAGLPAIVAVPGVRSDGGLTPAAVAVPLAGAALAVVVLVRRRRT